MRQRIRERWMLAGVTMSDPEIGLHRRGRRRRDGHRDICPTPCSLGRTVHRRELRNRSQLGHPRQPSIGNNCRVTSSALGRGHDGGSTPTSAPLATCGPAHTWSRASTSATTSRSRKAASSRGAVMGHFGYAGDATIGARVNLGAGMITCNYDGKDKHRTVVEDDAFIWL